MAGTCSRGTGVVLRAALAAGLLAAAPDGLRAQAPDTRTLLHRCDGMELRWTLQGGVNAVSETNLFWNFADTVAPGSGFDSDANWLELYAKPGLSFEKRLAGGDVLYGRLSAVASYTAGTDAYDTGDTGRITLEEGYLGYRAILRDGVEADLSLGPRELKLGTGMLIANGGSSGFERGALKFGPRKAWEMAVVAKLSAAGARVTAFFVDPNERPFNDGENRLAGLDLRYDASGGGYLGASWIEVLESGSPYVGAAPGGVGPPTVLPGARDGTRTLHLYAGSPDFDGALETWRFAADLAVQRNDRNELRAWAGRVQAGRGFDALPWSPRLTYSYQTFSGDDPATAALERFDPLYYEGSPSAWATGSKSSMVFINSNVQAHGLALRLQPSPRDTLTLRYAHIRANRLRSPIQFGQATRVDATGADANLVAGVTDPHLSDDVFLEYNRVIDPNTYLTAGVSVSFPGAGIRNTFTGNAPIWTGGVVNVVVNF